MSSQISKGGRFTLVNLNEGEKRHDQKSIEALLIKLSQFDNMNDFTPMMVDGLSNKEKKMVLNLLVIIKEKRCGKFKGRVVANGRK